MSSGEGWETHNLLSLLGIVDLQGSRLELSNEPNRVGASHPSLEDENKPSFQNVLFFRMPDNGQSPKASNLKIHNTTLSLAAKIVDNISNKPSVTLNVSYLVTGQ
jgi:hypothetical protein